MCAPLVIDQARTVSDAPDHGHFLETQCAGGYQGAADTVDFNSKTVGWSGRIASVNKIEIVS